MEKSTYHTKFIKGIPLGIPNKVMQGDGFYVSYNNYDMLLDYTYIKQI